jgi:hypothetical protein
MVSRKRLSVTLIVEWLLFITSVLHVGDTIDICWGEAYCCIRHTADSGQCRTRNSCSVCFLALNTKVSSFLSSPEVLLVLYSPRYYMKRPRLKRHLLHRWKWLNPITSLILPFRGRMSEITLLCESLWGWGRIAENSREVQHYVWFGYMTVENGLTM